MKKTLTAAMLCYNEEPWISRAIECVLRQTRQPDELIIVDDASTDGSYQIICSYTEKHPHITCLRNETNQGVVRSLELLMDHIKSDYVHFTAADDMIMPELYEVSMRMLEDHPQAGACSALTVEIDREDRNSGLSHIPVVSEEPVFIEPQVARTLLLRYGNWSDGTTTVWKRESIPGEILCNREFGPFVDSVAYLYIALTRGVCYVPQVLGRWRIIGEGFATEVLTDPEKFNYYFGNAVEYLERELEGIIPPQYIRNWKDWNHYTHRHLVLLGKYHKLLARLSSSMEKGVLSKRMSVLNAFIRYQWERVGLVLRYGILRPAFIRHKLSYLKKNRFARKIETREQLPGGAG